MIATARTDFANNPLDPSVQQRLRALLDLQGILQRQELTQDQLKLVRDQVSALGPASNPVMPNPQPIPNAPAVSTPVANPAQPYQHLLNQGTLAGLIKATAARQQPTPPPQAPSVLPRLPQSSTPQPSVAPAPENPLIASLRARGLLPAAPTPTVPPAAPAPSLPSAFPLIVPGQVRYTPPVPTPQASGSSDVTIDVQMNTASIKM